MVHLNRHFLSSKTICCFPLTSKSIIQFATLFSVVPFNLFINKFSVLCKHCLYESRSICDFGDAGQMVGRTDSWTIRRGFESKVCFLEGSFNESFEPNWFNQSCKPFANAILNANARNRLRSRLCLAISCGFDWPTCLFELQFPKFFRQVFSNWFLFNSFD